MLTIRLKEAFATRIATTDNLLQQDLQQLNFKAFLPEKVFLPLQRDSEITLREQAAPQQLKQASLHSVCTVLADAKRNKRILAFFDMLRQQWSL